MKSVTRRWWRPILGAVLLAAVLWRTGAGPVVGGVRSLDPGTLALGVALALPITLACAWRWHLVAEGLGVCVAIGPAVASCYRAQFLNATLPGGVLGDVHRGLRHGGHVGSTSRGLRSVVWERAAGQLVQALIAVAALLVLPSPVRGGLPVLGVAALVLVLVGVSLVARNVSCLCRLRQVVADDLRNGVLRGGAWRGVTFASTLAVAGHLATYLLAARAVGVTASAATLLPLALLVLVAAGIPTNVAGWGPREGAAAWVFGASGIGIEQGVATAAAYGALVFVASLPGAAVLLVAGSRGSAAARAERQPLRAGTGSRGVCDA